MRWVAIVVLIGAVSACGDDDQQDAACVAWAEHLGAVEGGDLSETEVQTSVQRVALLAIDSDDDEVKLVGVAMTGSLEPFDEAKFREAATGLSEACE